MPARRLPSASLSAKAGELATAVPQVVAHRMTRMALAGPKLSERDRKEFARMIAEKNSAFSESWNAMALQAMRSHQALSLSLARSLWTTPSLRNKATASAFAVEFHNAALGVFGKGLAPVHRKAVATPSASPGPSCAEARCATLRCSIRCSPWHAGRWSSCC